MPSIGVAFCNEKQKTKGFFSLEEINNGKYL